MSHDTTWLFVFAVLFSPVFIGAHVYRLLFRLRPLCWFAIPFLLYQFDELFVFGTESTSLLIEFGMYILAVGVAGALFLGYYFYTVNHILANKWPAKWNTFRSLCERRFHSDSGVPQTIVRGAALAFIAMGVCAALRYVAVRYQLAPWVPVRYLSAGMDSAFPGLQVALVPAIRSVVISLFLSFCVFFLRKIIQRSSLVVACGALLWVLTGSYIFPWYATPSLWFEWLVVFAFSFIACFALVHYDFLTLWFFLFSFYLILDNYTMWKLFQNVSNLEYTAVFALWVAVVALCVYSLLGPRLSAAWRRLSLALE